MVSRTTPSAPAQYGLHHVYRCTAAWGMVARKFLHVGGAIVRRELSAMAQTYPAQQDFNASLSGQTTCLFSVLWVYSGYALTIVFYFVSGGESESRSVNDRPSEVRQVLGINEARRGIQVLLNRAADILSLLPYAPYVLCSRRFSTGPIL